jgi:predicted CXXCH cytochrome family protein
MNNANSALCLSCHVSQPSDISAVRARTASAATATANAGTGSGVSHPAGSQYNPFTAWRESVHATAAHKLSKNSKVGPYLTVNQNACLSCHESHNAPGGAQLLGGPIPAIPNMDAATQNCITCHNGGSNLSPVIPNVYAEFAKGGHPFPAGSNRHSQQESLVLNNDRHATCVDCHNPHASQQTGSFASTAIRPSQTRNHSESARRMARLK